MVELLSPAGNIISLQSALNNNCDSIYIGLTNYNMRNNASNFSIDQIQKIVNLTHKNDSKIYICINTTLTDNELQEIEKQLPLLREYNVDAIIIADIGLIELAKENDLNIHMSIQENISNIQSLKTLKKLGVKRSLLSRELSLKQISQLSDKSPIETEIFIHGALCMAISGRCFLSSHFHDKSANHGECLQPCRKTWKLSSEDNEELLLKSDNEYTHFLSPQDLCMIEYIPELLKSNVDSFKIEGRAKPAEYVATTTQTYQKAIQLYQQDPHNYKFDPQWLVNLKKVFNRGFDQGLYFNDYHQNSSYNQSTYIKKGVGKIVNYYAKSNAAEIKLWDDISLNDEIIIQGPTTGSINHKIDSIQIYGKNHDFAKKDQNIGILVPQKVRENDLVYKLIKRTDNNIDVNSKNI